MFSKRGHPFPTWLLVLLDVVLINAAFAFAYWIRYEISLGPDVADANYVTLDAYAYIELSLTLILLAVYRLNGLYDPKLRHSWVDCFGVIVGGTTIGIAVLIVAVFGFRPFAYSRLIFLYGWVFIIAVLSLLRLVELFIRSYLRSRGIGLERVLMVGAGPQGMLIMQNIVAQPQLGYDVVGFVDEERIEDIGRFKYLGRLDDVPRIVRHTGVDLVIIALPSASHKRIVEIMMQCAKQSVSFRIVPDFYELSLNKLDINDINGIPLIGLKEVYIRASSLFIKRLIDVVVSLVVLLGASPLIFLISVAIKLESAGPILFTQTRAGRNGRHFMCYKFRSMKIGAEQEIEQLSSSNEASGPIFKMRNDPRLTRVGRVLRRLSLDELPQFVNILLGDMSLVGPRPPIPYEIEKYEEWHHKRFEAPPGLTGLWQVSGRSELTFDEMVLLDIWYIENWSLSLDLKIMLRTVPAVLLAKGAY